MHKSHQVGSQPLPGRLPDSFGLRPTPVVHYRVSGAKEYRPALLSAWSFFIRGQERRCIGESTEVGFRKARASDIFETLMEHLGQCRLCLRHAVLKNSHLLPKSIYKLLRTGRSSNPHSFVLTTRTGVRTSKQARQYLLCNECEQRFSGRGEAWVVANCWRGMKKFRIQEILAGSEPLMANEDLKVYAGASIPGLDMAKLVYFGSSVFWRASICHWKIMGDQIYINLGPYSELLRLFLLDSAPFPRNMVLHIGVSSLTTQALDLALFPRSSRTKTGIRRHRFIVPGIYFTLLVGNQITDSERLLCAAQSPESRISIWKQTDAELISGSARKILGLGRRLRY